MQLQEAGDDRARLYIPAELRDALDLTSYEQVTISLDCAKSQPVAHITPINSAEDTDGLVRTLTVKTNGQVQIDFPRQIAVAAGFLDTELALDRRGDHLVLSPDE